MDKKVAYIIALICCIVGWSVQVAITAGRESVRGGSHWGCGIFKCTGWSSSGDVGDASWAMKMFAVISILLMTVSTIIYFINGISHLASCNAINLPPIATTINKICIIAAIVTTLALLLCMIINLVSEYGDAQWGIFCEPIICTSCEVVKLVLMGSVAGSIGFGNGNALMG
eukprot:TRINITY_DN2418_c3_g1_i1.p1 TRINITY_DN2418_c3_g1~~TRINITY_DN2418_c3_g1_i1.p1  ORF type:complete len:197 (+),score=21.40 TRINITY_DN2418_c3_g1_i1:80-592(+)